MFLFSLDSLYFKNSHLFQENNLYPLEIFYEISWEECALFFKGLASSMSTILQIKFTHLIVFMPSSNWS